RGLVHLRRGQPALRHGSFALAGADGMAAAYVREDGADAFAVAMNAGDEPATLDLRVPGLEGRVLEPAAVEGWAWPATGRVRVDRGPARGDLPARGAALLRGAPGD